MLLALPGAAAAKKAASKGASDCTAKAVYPDGSEVERTCIVEGESGAKASRADTGGIHSNFRKLKDTRWHWNGWRDVIFRAEGSFLAPAEGCETEGNPRCRWSASEDEVYVMFGGAGRHTRQTRTNAEHQTRGFSVSAQRAGVLGVRLPLRCNTKVCNMRAGS